MRYICSINRLIIDSQDYDVSYWQMLLRKSKVFERGLRFDSQNSKLYNMDTLRKKLISIFCWITGLIFIAIVFIRKHYNPIEFETVVGDLGVSVTITSVAFWVFEKRLWRVLAGKMVFPPYIEGLWKGTLKYEDANTKDWKEKNVELDIKQSLTSTKFRLHTDESDSSSICYAYISEGINSKHEFVYTFQNNPKPSCRDRSPIHYGTCKLDIIDDASMKGEYWTSRNTKGELTLKKIKNGK